MTHQETRKLLGFKIKVSIIVKLALFSPIVKTTIVYLYLVEIPRFQRNEKV